MLTHIPRGIHADCLLTGQLAAIIHSGIAVFPLHDYKNTALMHSIHIPVSRVKVAYAYVKLLPIN